MSIIIKQKEFKEVREYKECCCSGLQDALKSGLFKIETDFRIWLYINGPTYTFKLNRIKISHCPYCGEKLEIINE